MCSDTKSLHARAPGGDSDAAYVQNGVATGVWSVDLRECHALDVAWMFERKAADDSSLLQLIKLLHMNRSILQIGVQLITAVCELGIMKLLLMDSVAHGH